MLFASRLTCCATIDLNSILKYFPRGYDDKFYIKIFGIYRTSDLLKNRGGIFAQTKWEEKLQRYSNTKNAFRYQILVLLDYRFQFNIKILSEGLW